MKSFICGGRDEKGILFLLDADEARDKKLYLGDFMVKLCPLGQLNTVLLALCSGNPTG